MEYDILKKIQNCSQSIFLSIPVYAHGGIPYLAKLINCCLLSPSSIFDRFEDASSALSAWLGVNCTSEGGIFTLGELQCKVSAPIEETL
jgi:hypothetical protein